MKKIIIMLLALALVAGCSNNKSEKEKTDPAPVSVNQSDQIQLASQKLIGSFGRALKAELMSAMNDGGPTEAIRTCAESAPAIAAQFSNEAVTIRRVSDKNRNAENGASEYEKDILAKFIGETAVEFFDETTVSETGKVYHYYKPIKAGKLCLNCHGPKENLDRKVAKHIDKSYPNDLAVGYAEGDLRGMFVVEMKLPEAEEMIKTLVADTLN